MRLPATVAWVVKPDSPGVAVLVDQAGLAAADGARDDGGGLLACDPVGAQGLD
jgi:hypothetical protein